MCESFLLIDNQTPPDVIHANVNARPCTATAVQCPLTQPTCMDAAMVQLHFARIAHVSDAEIAATKSTLLKLGNTPEYNNALLLQKFWRSFLLDKYKDRFKPINDAYSNALENLAIDKAEGRMTDTQYYEKGTEIEAVNQQKINDLIGQLTERAQQSADEAQSTSL